MACHVTANPKTRKEDQNGFMKMGQKSFLKAHSFVRNILNRLSEKTRKEIVQLRRVYLFFSNLFVKIQFLVVEFPFDF